MDSVDVQLQAIDELVQTGLIERHKLRIGEKSAGAFENTQDTCAARQSDCLLYTSRCV